MKWTAAVGVLCTLGITTACAGETADTTAETCEALDVTLELEEVSPLDFSAAAFLDGLENPQVGQLTWESPSSGAEFDHAGTSTTVSLTYHYTGGPIRFVQAQDDTGDCTAHVEIAAEIEFVTDDGMFDERWPVTLKAETPEGARWEHTLDFEATQGEFSPDLYTFPESPGGSNFGSIVSVLARGSSDEPDGALIGDLRIGHGNDTPLTQGVVARWQPD